MNRTCVPCSFVTNCRIFRGYLNRMLSSWRRILRTTRLKSETDRIFGFHVTVYSNITKIRIRCTYGWTFLNFSRLRKYVRTMSYLPWTRKVATHPLLSSLGFRRSGLINTNKIVVIRGLGACDNRRDSGAVASLPETYYHLVFYCCCRWKINVLFDHERYFERSSTIL